MIKTILAFVMAAFLVCACDRRPVVIVYVHGAADDASDRIDWMTRPSWQAVSATQCPCQGWR
jgi:hypothetical protein